MTAIDPPVPALVFLCRLEVELAAPLELGPALRGRRRIVPITGGRVEGRITGRILPGGADWQTVHADGTAELLARYTIETEEGALLDVENRGLRHGPPEVLAALARGEIVDPALYRMRTCARIETGAEAFRWLEHCLVLGSGIRLPDRVRLVFYEVG